MSTYLQHRDVLIGRIDISNTGTGSGWARRLIGLSSLCRGIYLIFPFLFILIRLTHIHTNTKTTDMKVDKYTSSLQTGYISTSN